MSFEGINLKRFLRGANDVPLSPEEERKMIRRFRRGDKTARDRIIESNQRFVIRMALKMRGQGLPLADLIQEGNLGLIEALERFDPGRNCRLISYASWWIRLYMQRGIEHKSRVVNIPVNKLCSLKRIKNIQHTYLKTEGRQPTLEEISKHTGIPVDKIESISGLSSSFYSIYANDDEGRPLEQSLPVHTRGRIHHRIWLGELRDRLQRVLDCLSPRERAVIQSRFGLTGIAEPASLRQVGKQLGLSAEGVRQIQKQAMEKLRGAENLHVLEGLLMAG
ncbi:MAG: RNA polymerase sigma factor RpoD/SigA [bacterium]